MQAILNLLPLTNFCIEGETDTIGASVQNEFNVDLKKHFLKIPER